MYAHLNKYIYIFLFVESFDEIHIESLKDKMSNQNENSEPKSFFYMILPVLLCGLSIPLSLVLWLGNLAFTFLTKSSIDTEGKLDLAYCECVCVYACI